MSKDDRAHGVTPGLSRDYADRTAERQAAFVRPHLEPGMTLLDLGCGPGTITLGLARAVSPGLVIGLDHDPQHVAEARAAAEAAGVDNVRFLVGDALSLPFEPASLDGAFENNVFVHLADRAAAAAAELHRVVRPGGFLAARDATADAVLWGAQTEPMARFDDLFTRWQQARGSDIAMGSRLPRLLREAGFTRTAIDVSADTKGTPDAVEGHAAIMRGLLDGPVGELSLERGWADADDLARMDAAIEDWGADPDAFFANVHVEVVGWKPR